MISIVMAYRDRRKLLINTLNSIRLSAIKDIEVIIADDCSEERIEDLKYPFPIKVLRIEPEQKWYTNPCIPFNLAMKAAKGDIVVIQNPECLHTCDILSDISKRITDEVYLAYGVYSLNKETTDKISVTKNPLNLVTLQNRGDVRVDGWFNHSHWRPAAFHFLTAITNKNLKRIGYFDERFASGVDYEDMEFRDRIKRNLRIEFVDNKIAFHQYHDLIAYNYPNLESLRNKNKQLYNQMRYPKVTIFTSSYNYSKYLRQAIDSVLAQTYPNFEYLLFDAGSTDDTLQIMQSYKDERIKVIQTENLTTGQLINKSVELATGKYWLWCPADDKFTPNLLEEKLKYTDRYPDSVLYDNFYYLNDKEEVTGQCDLKEITAAEFRQEIWKTCPIGFTGIMIPLELLKKNPFPEIEINEDYYWILDVIEKADFNLVPKKLHYKRQHGGSVSFSKVEQTRENVINIRNMFKKKYKKMRKIFIDLGGWTGKSAEFFIQNHPQGSEFEVYTFECDKRNIETIKSKKLPITLIEKAAWTSDGKIKYYYGNDDGGTMYPTKKTGNINPDNFYEVETVNIAEWIKANFSESDYIILKINCEGCEYEILPHLQKHGLIGWVNKWYIQWHWQKIGISESEHNIVQRLIPEWHEWDCQCNDVSFVDRFKATL